MKPQNDNYPKGRAVEKRVAAQLRRTKGASVKLSPGSRGPADLTVTFRNNKKQMIQVKSSRVGKAKSPTQTELSRLKKASSKAKATPVIMLLDADKTVRKYNAKTNKKMK